MGEVFAGYPGAVIRIGHIGSVDGCVYSAGEDAVDVDVVCVMFGGKAFSEGDDGTFSNAVGRHFTFAGECGTC